MAEERNEILPDMEEMPYTRPTADAGTSDDANYIGTAGNARPADRFATGGSGDTPGTIGNATGPLATPSPPAQGEAFPIREDDPADRDAQRGIRVGNPNESDLPPGPYTGKAPIGAEGYGRPENDDPGAMPPIGANLAQTGIGDEAGAGGATSASGAEDAGDGVPGD